MPSVIGNLSPAAQQLKGALRRAREARGLASRTLAYELGYSHAVVSNWETGRRIPTFDQVIALVDAMSITGEERQSILAYAREATGPNPLARLSGVPPVLADTIAYERLACAIDEWAPAIVPDLLQTSDYTRSVATCQGCDPADVEVRSLIQAGRREILTRTNAPVEFTAVIGHSALREPIAPPQVMAEQLDFLLAQNSRPNIKIRIMPASAGWHFGLAGPFSLYRLSDGQECARHEHMSSACVETGRADQYRRGLALMLGEALSVGKSIRCLSDVAQEWREVA